MKSTTRSAGLVAAVVLSISVSPAAWAVPDHLQCFKIKDDITKTGYTATITPDDPTFPAAVGCTIKLGAKLLCVDSTKSAVTPPAPGAPDGGQPGKFFCYKAKCPVSEPTFTGADQFGSHNIEVKKTQFLCAPVDTVSPTTTLPECFVPGDCPGVDTQCSQRSCTMNTCGTTLAPPGTPLMTQTPGDCQTAVCDGMGSVGSQIDSMDIPADDGNDCTGEACAMGFPTHPALSTGTTCSSGGGTVCNGAGSCVQCNTASNCPGMDTDCQMRTCTSGTCGFTFASAGTPTGGQTSGNCRQIVCDGSGGTMTENDDADLPIDGNDCTNDVCTSGVASNPPQPQGLACMTGGGSVCNGSGQCVQCNVASNCPGVDGQCQTRTCTANNCGVSFQPLGTSCTEGGGTQCDGMGTCL